jgi:hypothetical protein
MLCYDCIVKLYLSYKKFHFCLATLNENAVIIQKQFRQFKGKNKEKKFIIQIL